MVAQPRMVVDVVVVAAGVLLALVGLTELLRLAAAPERPGAAPEPAQDRPSAQRRLVRVAGVAALAFAGIATAGALAGDADVTPQRAGRCNGHAALCDRTLDRVAFVATHNAMAADREPGWLFPRRMPASTPSFATGSARCSSTRTTGSRRCAASRRTSPGRRRAAASSSTSSARASWSRPSGCASGLGFEGDSPAGPRDVPLPRLLRGRLHARPSRASNRSPPLPRHPSRRRSSCSRDCRGRHLERPKPRRSSEQSGLIREVYRGLVTTARGRRCAR